MTFRNFSILVFDVQNNLNLLLLVIIFKESMFQIQAVISRREPKKISHSKQFVFGLTIMYQKKQTLIDICCQKVIVGDGFLRHFPFWPMSATEI